MAKAKAKVKAKGKPAGKGARKAAPVDFSDADSVGRAMAKVLDVPEEDVQVSESHYEGFGTGYSFWKLEVGRKEYHVAESEETAHALAIAVVTQDLEESPENFNQSFIEGHIDKDHLRKELMSDVESGNYDRLLEDAQRRPIEFFNDHGDLEMPEPTDQQARKWARETADEDSTADSQFNKLRAMSTEEQWAEIGEEPEVEDRDINAIAEEEAKEQLKDPIAYLEEFYGREDAIKKAIEIGGIDEAAAAEEAVGADGIGHFLSGYDSNIHDGPDGIVYWRTN